MRGGLRVLLESCLVLGLVSTTLIALLKLLFMARRGSPIRSYLPDNPEGALAEVGWSRRPAFLPSTQRPTQQR